MTQVPLSESKIRQNLICTCTTCGEQFVFSRKIQEEFNLRGWKAPNICYLCRKKRSQQQQEARVEKEKTARQKQWEKDYAEFEKLLKTVNQVTLFEIPTDSKTLFIIGNGFDLMHRVPSSYYSFQKSLGKNSALLFMLETFLTPDDIWADFEDALAHFNMNLMASPDIIGMWLDDFQADPDESLADYYSAIETAVGPMEEVAEELPKRFRRWVRSLAVGTADRPLKSIITSEGRVLNFNYTEFVETLYGVPADHVCYIHGCRRKVKGKKPDELVLGHRPGASASAFEEIDTPKKAKTFRSALVEIAQESAIDLMSSYDKKLTKDCDEIIRQHNSFFDSLSDIHQIVCIGHSFSEVDWPYFQVIAGKTHAKWVCGCHGIRDLKNLKTLCDHLGLNDMAVFRTDEIFTMPLQVEEKAPKKRKDTVRTLDATNDWRAVTTGQDLTIFDSENNESFRVQFGANVSRALFHDRYLVLITAQPYDGIFLFSLPDNSGGSKECLTWQFINELQGIPNQCLINRRLRHVMLTEDALTFVYNSRIRKYSLSDGELIYSNRCQHAGERQYQGLDLLDRMIPKGWVKS